MSEQQFYVEDTVCLKLAANHTKIGVVDRTVGQVETHVPSPDLEFTNGINRGAGISRDSLVAFLRDGIPPRGTVLVTWAHLPWQADLPSTLILERDLTLLDRSLLAGDVVKRSARDEMSGTVTQTATQVALSQPHGWEGGDVRNQVHSVSDPHHFLEDIPSEELKWASEYHEQDFVIYQDWVGRVTDVEEEVHLRLGNNSVVVPEDYEALELSAPDGYCQVGDLVRTKKANLRRGRWIYGAYNAGIEPEGYIADVRPQTVVVNWLESRYPTGEVAEPPRPPEELTLDELQSGEVRIYDRRRRSGSNLGSGALRLNLEVVPGDRVRFKDLAGAAVKYNIPARSADDSTQGNHLTRISRSDSLGYDINVFIVVSTKTTVDVAWQDGTTSRALSSNSLVPYEVFDAEDEVWPGEMIITKANVSDSDSLFKSERVGIVQTVDSRDRLAKVRWIPGAELLLTVGEEPTLLPGSHTGQVQGAEVEISQYDILPVAGLNRRRGDFVAIVPSPSTGTIDGDTQSLSDVRSVLSAPADSASWFGEIVHLGLDGLLTVRLAAASPVRDVCVPWECTHLIWSSDEDSLDPADSFVEDLSEDEMDVPVAGMPPIGGLLETIVNRFTRNVDSLIDHDGHEAFQEDDEDDDDDDDDDHSSVSWETEDETDSDSDISMQEGDTNAGSSVDGSPSLVRDAHEAHDTNMDGAADTPETRTGTLPPTAVDVASSFSYSTMWATGTSELAPFAVLDGAPPSNHPWAEAKHSMNGKLLRRLHKEHGIISRSLPDGALVRTWESSLDCMRILLLGPLGTPYEYAPFLFDLYLDSSFPSSPPQLFFHSWTDGQGPCNPNLYEDGKVCLSLLGTWPGDDKGESWTKDSTILQIIVSLLGLVLVSEPYYNEAGYEIRKGSVECKIPSSMYSERTFLRTRNFISRALRHPTEGFEEAIKTLYLSGPDLLRRAIDSAIQVVARSKARKANTNADDRTVSPGALVPLIRQIESLIGDLQTAAGKDTQRLQQALQAARGLSSST